MGRTIDLNADLGEGYGPWSCGDDAGLLDLVTSANIACGGHAGDAETMFATAQAAAARGVGIGAHPGYRDMAGFGRRVIPMAADQIGRMVVEQVGAFRAVAALAGASVGHVKLHGALANLAAADAGVAQAVVAALRAAAPDLAVLAMAGTTLEQVARAAGLVAHAEVFADRGYLPDGRLIPRGQAGAMIHDADLAADRLLTWLDTGEMPVLGGGFVALRAQSICVHGDTPGAMAFARTIHRRLTAAGVRFARFVGA
jgi:UPF0271 protein